MVNHFFLLTTSPCSERVQTQKGFMSLSACLQTTGKMFDLHFKSTEKDISSQQLFSIKQYGGGGETLKDMYRVPCIHHVYIPFVQLIHPNVSNASKSGIYHLKI